MKLASFVVLLSITLFCLGSQATVLECHQFSQRGLSHQARAQIDISQGFLTVDYSDQSLALLTSELVVPYDRVAVDFDRVSDCSSRILRRSDGSLRHTFNCQSGLEPRARVDLEISADHKSIKYSGVVSTFGYDDFGFDAEFKDCRP